MDTRNDRANRKYNNLFRLENELYYEDNTQMLFGDAKQSLQSVIAAVKELLG